MAKHNLIFKLESLFLTSTHRVCLILMAYFATCNVFCPNPLKRTTQWMDLNVKMETITCWHSWQLWNSYLFVHLFTLAVMLLLLFDCLFPKKSGPGLHTKLQLEAEHLAAVTVRTLSANKSTGCSFKYFKHCCVELNCFLRTSDTSRLSWTSVSVSVKCSKYFKH